jgi:hypothetical protein
VGGTGDGVIMGGIGEGIIVGGIGKGNKVVGARLGLQPLIVERVKSATKRNKKVDFFIANLLILRPNWLIIKSLFFGIL